MGQRELGRARLRHVRSVQVKIVVELGDLASHPLEQGPGRLLGRQRADEAHGQPSAAGIANVNIRSASIRAYTGPESRKSTHSSP